MKEKAEMGKRLFYPVGLLSIAMIISLILPLYGQTPTPPKTSNKPKDITKNNAKGAKIPQKDTKGPSSIPVFSIPTQTNKPPTDNAGNHNDKPPSGWWLIGFTAALVAVGILQYFIFKKQAHWMRKQSEEINQSIAIAKETAETIKIQAETMHHELVLTHRPRLRVRNVVISNLRRDAGGELPKGELHIDNIGGTPAQIANIGCWVEWLRGGLPMDRPYDGKNPTNPISTRLEPGQSFTLSFTGDNPMGEALQSIIMRKNEYSLYVMGYVEYSDNITIPRRTTFCRKYRILEKRVGEYFEEKRFYAVDDPDYEEET